MTGFSDLFKIPVSPGTDGEQPKTDGVVSGPSKTSPPETVPLETIPASEIITPYVPPLQRKLQIREAKLVQEGHTYGEQTVYDALWKHGTVVNESTRLITIGFLRMASVAGLAESNCKAAVAGLLDKLAIERLPDRNIAQGRTYKIYGWAAVLARRRAAGLTHVIKSRGVVFVDPKTGKQLTVAKTAPRKARETRGIETGGPVSIGPVYSPASSEPENSIRTTSDSPKQPDFSTKVADLAARLRRDLDPAFDDSAARRLWRECESAVPDCTLDEIIHFVALKAQTIYRDRSIRNPIGLLLMSIPEFFTGSAVHDLREQNGREEKRRRELQKQQRKYWKEVADSPTTTSEERELALRFLTEIE